MTDSIVEEKLRNSEGNRQERRGGGDKEGKNMMTDDAGRVAEMRVGRKEKTLAGRDYTFKVARMKNCG